MARDYRLLALGFINNAIIHATMEWLPYEYPAYAPELNPVEALWNDIKRHTGMDLLRHKQVLGLGLRGATPISRYTTIVEAEGQPPRARRDTRGGRTHTMRFGYGFLPSASDL